MSVIIAISMVESLAFVLLFLLVFRARVRPVLAELGQVAAASRGALLQVHTIASALEAAALHQREAVAADRKLAAELPDVLARTATARPPPTPSRDPLRPNAGGDDDGDSGAETRLDLHPLKLPVMSPGEPLDEEREVVARLRRLEVRVSLPGLATIGRARRLIESARVSGKTPAHVVDAMLGLLDGRMLVALSEREVDTMIVAALVGRAGEVAEARKARLPELA